MKTSGGVKGRQNRSNDTKSNGGKIKRQKQGNFPAAAETLFTSGDLRFLHQIPGVFVCMISECVKSFVNSYVWRGADREHE